MDVRQLVVAREVLRAEHRATLDYSSEEGGCLSCHDPHGSYIARLLKQPLEAPSFQLCSQCHSVPGHRNNSVHGTMWAETPYGTGIT